MNINEMAKLYNDGMSLKEIGEKIGKSKSTVQRMFVREGYVFSDGKYVPREMLESDSGIKRDINYDEFNVSRETMNNGNNETINNVSRETIARTYEILKDVDRALKIMCAIEDKKVIDVVRQAIRNSIDDKYFNM